MEWGIIMKKRQLLKYYERDIQTEDVELVDFIRYLQKVVKEHPTARFEVEEDVDYCYTNIVYKEEESDEAFNERKMAEERREKTIEGKERLMLEMLKKKYEN